MLHGGEIAFELRHKIRLRAALKDLRQKRPARIENLAGECCSTLDKADNSQLIRLAMARGVRRHVRHHHVRAAADHGAQLLRRAIVEEIHLREHHAGKLRHFQKIDGDDLAPALDRADAFRSDLAPSAGRGAKIDHHLPRFEKALLVVDLAQLISGARAEAVTLGLHDVRIVKLTFQPEFRRQLALAAGLHRHVQPPGGVFRHRSAFQGHDPQNGNRISAHPYDVFAASSRHLDGFQAAGITPSARIISTSMPSRRPRSATRRRGSGNALRMASRMAHPASTRSARSVPIQAFFARS